MPSRSAAGPPNWRCPTLDGAAWTAYDASDLIYDSKGVASFTTSTFGGYAIVGEVLQTGLGDFNGDGSVDIADYTTWADHFGMSKDYLAPGSYDGAAGDLISIADYTTWADHFGASYTVTGVPEPCTAILLAAGAMAMLRRRAAGH